jgi:hypothetical protein
MRKGKGKTSKWFPFINKRLKDLGEVPTLLYGTETYEKLPHAKIVQNRKELSGSRRWIRIQIRKAVRKERLKTQNEGKHAVMKKAKSCRAW